MFSVLPYTAACTLLEAIPDPAFILTETLQVARVNQAFLEHSQRDTPLIGQYLNTILHISSAIPEETLVSLLKEKTEGYQISIQHDQSQTRYTLVRVTLPLNQPAVLIRIHPVTDAYTPANLYQKCIDKLFGKIPELIGETSQDRLYEIITRTLRDLFDDDIILSFVIDEKSGVFCLKTLSMPDCVKKPTRTEIETLITRTFPIPVSEHHLLPYKIYETTRTRGMPALTSRPPDEITHSTIPLQKYDFLCTGLVINDTLTGIIGIGKMDSGIHPRTYEKILQAVSKFYILCESKRVQSDTHTSEVQQYRDTYRTIYNLLTEKSNAEENRRAESEMLQGLMGITLDHMKVVCCTLTRGGAIIKANGSMRELCSVQEKDILSKPQFTDITPPPVRDVLLDLMNSTDFQGEIGSYQVVVNISADTQRTWCLIRPSIPDDERICVCIGEKKPAFLIHYILMYDYWNCAGSSSLHTERDYRLL